MPPLLRLARPHHSLRQPLATASVCYMLLQPPAKPVPVRIPAEMVVRIDRLRGLVPREAYVRDLLGKALKRQERKARKP